MTIVVTGAMGCGKSTVVQLLLKEFPTYSLFDFDRTVHALYDHPLIKAKLIAEFGVADRAVIREVVYNDVQKMAVLASVFADELNEAMDSAMATPHMILDVPLFFEYFTVRYAKAAKTVVCVGCSSQVQYARIRSRNGWSDDQIDAVLRHQLPQHRKRTLADIVVINDGSVDDLKTRITATAQEIKDEQANWSHSGIL